MAVEDIDELGVLLYWNTNRNSVQADDDALTHVCPYGIDSGCGSGEM